jgi:hypothetical protein
MALLCVTGGKLRKGRLVLYLFLFTATVLSIHHFAYPDTPLLPKSWRRKDSLDYSSSSPSSPKGSGSAVVVEDTKWSVSKDEQFVIEKGGKGGNLPSPKYQADGKSLKVYRSFPV